MSLSDAWAEELHDLELSYLYKIMNRIIEAEAYAQWLPSKGEQDIAWAVKNEHEHRQQSTAQVAADPGADDVCDDDSIERYVAYLVDDMGYSRNECPGHCPHKADEHAHLHSPGNPASIGIPPRDFIYWADGTSIHPDPTRAKPLLCGHEGRDAESERKHAIVCTWYQRILLHEEAADDR